MSCLAVRLVKQGLGPPLVRLEADRIVYSDQLELVHTAGTYRVAEMERGQVLEEYSRTEDVEKAFDVFVSQLADRSVFLSSFPNEVAAEQFRVDLELKGIRALPNHVLNLRDVAPLYRLFVPVPDWHRARDFLKTWEIQEQSA